MKIIARNVNQTHSETAPNVRGKGWFGRVVVFLVVVLRNNVKIVTGLVNFVRNMVIIIAKFIL